MAGGGFYPGVASSAMDAVQHSCPKVQESQLYSFQGCSKLLILPTADHQRRCASISP